MYEKVQGENENRRAYIPDSLFHLYIPRVHIVKSHKSFLWILASKPGLHQDKHNQQIYTAPNPLIIHGVIR